MKKRFLALLLVMILIISTIGVSTAFAKISGSTEVVAGKTYTITISKSATASSISGNISWSGFASGSETMWKDSGSGMSEGITASVKISIAVPSGTPAGSTCTINLSGQISTFDGTNVGESSYSESKTLTVVTKTSSSTNTTDNDTPKATKAPTEWDIAKEKIAAMDEGGTLTIDITGDDHSLSAKTYQSLLDKKGTFIFNFGTYSCILNTSLLDKLGEDVNTLDLGLKFDADPDFSSAVGGNDVYQLHFAHEGELPGKISFKFKADKNAPGDTVYLYYYYGSSKVIESIQSAVVDADGFVTFDIYHCSAYFVSSSIIQGAAGIVVQPEPEPTPEPTPTVAPTPEPTPEPTPVPTEAPAKPVMASASGFPLIVLIAVGIGAALIGVLITMLVCKVGPFKKKSRHSA